MDAPMTYWDRRCRSCVLPLFGALGILAFLVSAVSPQDDTYQHECIRSARWIRIVVKNTRELPAKTACPDAQPLELITWPDFGQPPETTVFRNVKNTSSSKPPSYPHADRAPPLAYCARFHSLKRVR